MNGLLLIDKPRDVTSFDVVGRVRKVADMKKVGHMGTLDKAATGLLAVMLGKCTKLQRFIEEKVSRYECEMRLGQQTDTLDRNGEVVRECEWEHVSEEDLSEALSEFTGDLEQRPPKYSAVKIEGRRASDWARDDEAEDVEPEARPVEIRELRLASFQPPDASLEVECVSGTYVRSLVRDLAETVGTCAFATAIRRTATNDFSIDDAVELEDLDRESLEESLLSPLRMVRQLPRIDLDSSESTAIGYGQRVELDNARADAIGVRDGDWVAAVDEEGDLAAVVECRAVAGTQRGFELQPERVLKTSD